MNKQICYNLFCGFATCAQYVCYGVYGEMSGEFSGEFPLDVSDDIFFRYNSIFCLLQAFRRGLRRVSGGVSGELSLFCFIFVGEPFFATLKQNRDFFATRQQKGHVSAWEPGGWEIKSPGDAQHCPFLFLGSVLRNLNTFGVGAHLKTNTHIEYL
jgi:hypothetical protein